MPQKTLEFYFDIGSPNSYLGWRRLPELAGAHGVDVVCRPVLLGGIFKATGNASPAAVPAKGRYMIADLQRHARRHAVRMRFNPHFPLNTLVMMRALTAMQLQTPERFADLVELLFQGVWMEARKLDDPAVLADWLAQGGFDPAGILAMAEDPAAKQALKDHTEAAVRRGVFGVPSFFVGEEMFFGQDRIDFVREALEAA